MIHSSLVQFRFKKSKKVEEMAVFNAQHGFDAIEFATAIQPRCDFLVIVPIVQE